MPGTGFSPMSGAHWLHGQKSSRIPRRFVFFDTEAHRATTATGEEQSWRLAVSASVNWREKSATWSPVTPVRHGTPDSLIDAITEWSRKDARTVVVAHNLAYDVRISGLLYGLLVRGWEIERPNFVSETISFEAVRAGHHLVFVDSLSLMPLALAKVGRLIGMLKPELPTEQADDDSWYQRCEADVRILSTAYLIVMDCLRSRDIGGWARSGAGIGWHTFIRRHLAHKVLVHADPQLRDIEAGAMYAGRAEVWRHGVLAPGPFYEWDYKMAYGHICAEAALPAQYLYKVEGLSLKGLEASQGRYCHLVHAEVTQDTPMAPWRDATGVCWPVGTFEGWYWDRELLTAAAAGATVRVGTAHRYTAAPWLSSWATWAMGLVDDDSTAEARVIGAVAKHWTRAVPGRSAMRYRRWDNMGDAWQPGVSYMPLVDATTGARGAALTLGPDRWEAWRMDWWAEALPQLLSYVMAEARCRLWEMMLLAGLGHVVYVDTDALIVDATGHARLTLGQALGTVGSLRPKGSHRLLELIAPQLVEGSTYRRLSGVPRGARRMAQRHYDGEIWEGLTTSMAEGHPDKVRIRKASFDVQGLDTRRVHLPGGATVPFEVRDNERYISKDEAS